jgi:hypothetical protein
MARSVAGTDIPKRSGEVTLEDKSARSRTRRRAATVDDGAAWRRNASRARNRNMCSSGADTAETRKRSLRRHEVEVADPQIVRRRDSSTETSKQRLLARPKAASGPPLRRRSIRIRRRIENAVEDERRRLAGTRVKPGRQTDRRLAPRLCRSAASARRGYEQDRDNDLRAHAISYSRQPHSRPASAGTPACRERDRAGRPRPRSCTKAGFGDRVRMS